MTTHDHTPTSAGLCADDLTPTPARCVCHKGRAFVATYGCPFHTLADFDAADAPTPAGDDQAEGDPHDACAWSARWEEADAAAAAAQAEVGRLSAALAARPSAPTVPLDPCPPGCILHGSAPTVTTEQAEARDALAHECDLADADMRKWVRVPVRFVRAALGIEVAP